MCDCNADTNTVAVAVVGVVATFVHEYSDADKLQVAKMKTRNGAVGVEVKVRGVWKLFVPELRRQAMVFEIHGQTHKGVGKVCAELIHHYWPGKQEFVQALVDSCSCSAQKERRRLQNRALASITADGPMELVCADVFGFGGLEYLTILDVFSLMPWVQCWR